MKSFSGIILQGLDSTFRGSLTLAELKVLKQAQQQSGLMLGQPLLSTKQMRSMFKETEIQALLKEVKEILGMQIQMAMQKSPSRLSQEDAASRLLWLYYCDIESDFINRHLMGDTNRIFIDALLSIILRSGERDQQKNIGPRDEKNEQALAAQQNIFQLIQNSPRLEQQHEQQYVLLIQLWKCIKSRFPTGKMCDYLLFHKDNIIHHESQEQQRLFEIDCEVYFISQLDSNPDLERLLSVLNHWSNQAYLLTLLKQFVFKQWLLSVGEKCKNRLKSSLLDCEEVKAQVMRDQLAAIDAILIAIHHQLLWVAFQSLDQCLAQCNLRLLFKHCQNNLAPEFSLFLIIYESFFADVGLTSDKVTVEDVKLILTNDQFLFFFREKDMMEVIAGSEEIVDFILSNPELRVKLNNYYKPRDQQFFRQSCAARAMMRALRGKRLS